MLPLSRVVPLTIATALFMEHLDSSIISTSLPVMSADLGVRPQSLNLAITSYLVAMAVFIPASGWVADRFGARRVFLAAVGVFLAGSIACGLSIDLGSLVAGRILQGAGGAMMTPVGRLVLLRTVPKSELISAMVWLTMPALIGPVVGPMLGGFISTYSSWRWIFWVNVPIGILGIWVARRYLPHIAEEDVPPFDWPGFILSAVGLSALVFALETAGRDVVAASVSIATGAAGLAMLIAYARRARGSDRPLVDLSLMRIASFRLAILGGSVFRVGVGAVPFLVPLQLQIGFGRSALESGLTTFIGAVGSFFMKPIAKVILGRYGFRRTLAVNGILAGGLMALVGTVSAATPVLWVMLILFLAGLMRSLEFTAINAVSYADLDAEVMSRATSFSSMAQQLSLSSGVALSAFILHLLAGADGSIRAGDISVALVAVGLASSLAGLVFLRLSAATGVDMLERHGGGGGH